jgi:ubiquinone/menaquinone biosynthesis C-methylase UbiE
MKSYHEDWEEVAKTDDAHKAIAADNWQNEKYYNMSGIITSAEFLKIVKELYKEDCQNLNVVEIGCGTGRETRYIAECFHNVLAIDASRTMIEKAVNRTTNENIIFDNNVSGKIPMNPEKTDIVYSFIVFQHCKHDTVKQYFDEAFRVLKKGGRFIFQLGINDVDYEPANYGDVGKMTENTLISGLINSGFKIEKIATDHFGLHIAVKN